MLVTRILNDHTLKANNGCCKANRVLTEAQLLFMVD